MVVLIIGVSGVGKTTIGAQLAAELGWSFIDADTFHSPENIAKMRQGIPLTDSDRAPWLSTLRAAIDAWIQTGTDVVLACSALKQTYRTQLQGHHDQVKWVHLQGNPVLIQQRLKQRMDHFMNADLLESQLDALEVPDTGVSVDIAAPPDEIVAQLCDQVIRWNVICGRI